MATCKHMNCREGELPRIRQALDGAGLRDVSATFEPCPWCGLTVLCVESPRPDDRGAIRAALIIGGFIVPDASGHRNNQAMPVERGPGIDLRFLT